MALRGELWAPHANNLLIESLGFRPQSLFPKICLPSMIADFSLALGSVSTVPFIYRQILPSFYSDALSAGSW